MEFATRKVPDTDRHLMVVASVADAPWWGDVRWTSNFGVHDDHLDCNGQGYGLSRAGKGGPAPSDEDPRSQQRRSG